MPSLRHNHTRRCGATAAAATSLGSFRRRAWRTLSARRLAGGDAQHLGREADRTLDLEALVLGALDQVTAHLLKALDIAAGKGDADAVHLGGLAISLELLRLHGSHVSLSA